MAIATVAISVLALIYIYFKLVEFLRWRAQIDEIHGPSPYWFVGNALHINPDPYCWLEQAQGCSELWSFPRMYRIWFFTTPYVIISGADEAEAILSNNKQIDKSDEYRFLHPWLGQGLFVKSGAPWRPRRKLVTPAFHASMLQTFVPMCYRHARTLSKVVETMVDKEPFDAYKFMPLCMLDIQWESVTGSSINAQLYENTDYVEALKELIRIIEARQKEPWFWYNLPFNVFGRGLLHNRCVEVMHKYVDKAVENRIRYRQENAEKQPQTCILDHLLDFVDTNQLPANEVRNECSAFMFGGFDTSSSSISFTLFLIGAYPEVQAKVHAEVDAVLGDDPDRELCEADVRKMSYLECVIKESLRLYPSAAFIGRKLSDDAKIDNLTIPKGTQILLSPHLVHRDPKHWEKPEKFIPERFLPENVEGRHPYAYIPFSAGSRNCIGQRYAITEEKVVLATLFRRFKFRSIHRPDQVRLKFELMLRPDRLMMEVSRR